ncbi:hypothetical protein BLL52_0729 [Rhodoferax antarcticus ANT.BR]|uniref:Uncharacterized protein n=1 Tax=Rhodoferax antarcticus ANT.BR TaxID=1111071 RepID=A0A1Q8YI52_9BURK|nr:hypothetical protein BLL52_0729 [Rhodoferax antarcticus ANT.BR]
MAAKVPTVSIKFMEGAALGGARLSIKPPYFGAAPDRKHLVPLSSTRG